MTGSSLDAAYFEGIFGSDDDPWDLSSSPYEDAKFDRTTAAVKDRGYARALEIGCAQGVLTQRLAPLCVSLLAVDISGAALELARARIGERPDVSFRQLTFPHDLPEGRDFDLVILSEVAYYWNDADLERCAKWLIEAVVPSGRVLLVHWVGETDYPQTGDGAVEKVWDRLAKTFRVERAERTVEYRLDLWARN